MIQISYKDAAAVFKLQGKATELLIYTRPGVTDSVASRLRRLISPWSREPGLHIQTRKLVRQYMERGFNMQAGVFTMLFTVAFAIAVPTLLVLSGFGLSERRKTVGLMKATGWQTLEVMELIAWENLILALCGSLSTFLLAVIWIKGFNGALIAPLFIGGAEWLPEFSVPSRFYPLPLLLAFMVILNMTGTLYTAWKTAVAPPLTTLK